eukprot:g9472.t1
MEELLFGGNDEMGVMGAAVQPTRPRDKSPGASIRGGGFRMSTSPSKGFSSLHADEPGDLPASSAGAVTSSMDLAIVGRNRSRSPGCSQLTSKNTIGGGGAEESRLLDAKMSSMEADLLKLRKELSGLAAANDPMARRELAAEYGPKLRASHDALLAQLESEYAERKKEADRKLKTTASSSLGIGAGRSKGNQANRYQLPPDASVMDAHDEMIVLLKRCFERQASLPGANEYKTSSAAKDLYDANGPGKSMDETVAVSNLCLAIEVDPGLKSWLGRLARLDAYTDETTTLQEVLNLVRNAHPVARLTWAEFKEYFTRGGSSVAKRLPAAVASSSSGTADLSSSGAGGVGGGTGVLTRGARERGSGSANRPRSANRSPAAQPASASSSRSAKKKTAGSTAGGKNSVQNSVELRSSLEAKTQAALQAQTSISVYTAIAQPESAMERAEGGEGRMPANLALVGLRVMMGQQFGTLDAAYKKLDKEGTGSGDVIVFGAVHHGFVTSLDFLTELRAGGSKYESGFRDGSIDSIIDMMKNEDSTICIGDLLGIPKPAGAGMAERKYDAVKGMPVVPKDEAFSVYTYGQGPGAEEGTPAAPPQQQLQNYVDDQAAFEQATAAGRMEAFHWKALEQIFQGIDSKKVDVQRFLYKVRDDRTSKFVQNGWLSLIVEEVRDPLTAELRQVTLSQCLQYLESLKLYESMPFSFFRKRISDAPRKRFPKLCEYVPDAEVDSDKANAWLQENYKVDAKLLSRVFDVFKHCGGKAKFSDFPIRKAEFILQLKQKASLLAELHRVPLMGGFGADGGSSTSYGSKAKSFVPMWAELLPGLAGVDKDLITWVDVLEALKARCDVFKTLTAPKDLPRGDSGSGEEAGVVAAPVSFSGSLGKGAASTSSGGKLKYEPIVVANLEEEEEMPEAAKQLQAMVQSIERGEMDDDPSGPRLPYVAPIVTQNGDEYESPSEKRRREQMAARSGNESLSPIPPAESFDARVGERDFSLVKGPELAEMIDEDDRLNARVGDLPTERDVLMNRLTTPIGRLHLVLELDPTCVSLKSLSRRNNLLQLELETEAVELSAADRRLGFATQGSFDIDGVIGYRVISLRFQGRVFIEDGERVADATAGAAALFSQGATGGEGVARKSLSKQELADEERKLSDWATSRRLLEKHGDKYNPGDSIKMPNFCAKDNYWEIRAGTRIRDKRLRQQIAEKEQDELYSTGFVANPVPQHIYLPRYSQMDLADRSRKQNYTSLGKSQSSAGLLGGGTGSTGVGPGSSKRGRSMSRDNVAAGAPANSSKRSSSVEEQNKQGWEEVQKNYQENSRYQLYKANRSVSVPPRKDKVYRALFPGKIDDTLDRAKKPFVSNPEGYSFKAGKPMPAKAADDTQWPLKVKEVPDFKLLHAKNQRALMEKKKQQKERLGLTKTQPFVFSQPKRVMRAPPTDTEDLRWQKAVGATNTSSSSTSKHAFSRPNLIESENPNQMPPKTTAKTLQYQQWNAQKIRERQQREEQHRLELESYANPPEEIKERVQNTLSKEKQDQALGLERRTYDLRIGQIATERRWKKQLKEMRERLNNRPLLMERTQMEQARERARQRALLRVKANLEVQGVKNVDGHFNREELNMMEGL